MEILKKPLTELIKNHTTDIAAAVTRLADGDVQTVIDFFDQVFIFFRI